MKAEAMSFDVSSGLFVSCFRTPFFEKRLQERKPSAHQLLKAVEN